MTAKSYILGADVADAEGYKDRLGFMWTEAIGARSSRRIENAEVDLIFLTPVAASLIDSVPTCAAAKTYAILQRQQRKTDLRPNVTLRIQVVTTA